MGLKSFQQQTFENVPYYTMMGRIISYEDLSGTNPYSPNYEPFDLALRLDVLFTSSKGAEWDKRVFIVGNLGWEGKELKDWGKTGWRINDFFMSMGIEFGKTTGVPEITKCAIPVEALKMLQNRLVLTLHYVTSINENRENAFWYNMWDTIYGISDERDEQHVEEVESRLLKRFEKSTSNGCPKNFKPELLLDQIESSPRTEPELANSGGIPDNDLPF